MSKQLIVLKTDMNINHMEAERAKHLLRAALTSGGPLILSGGMTLETITLEDDTLRCEYCDNPIDKCCCGAARTKVKVESNIQRVPQWELDGIAQT